MVHLLFDDRFRKCPKSPSPIQVAIEIPPAEARFSRLSRQPFFKRELLSVLETGDFLKPLSIKCALYAQSFPEVLSIARKNPSSGQFFLETDLRMCGFRIEDSVEII